MRFVTWAALALAAATLRSSEDLRDMAIGFPPVEEPDDVYALAVAFRVRQVPLLNLRE